MSDLTRTLDGFVAAFAALSPEEKQAARRENRIEVLWGLYKLGGYEATRKDIGRWVDANPGVEP